jgi:hypothetical protein
MKHIISYSGGASSFVAAHLAVQKYGKENVELVFCDTLIEDEDLYRFVDEGAKALDLQLVTLADGRDPWDVFRDKRYIGNSRTAHCSIVLKCEQFEHYIKANYKPDECVIHFGFDFFEEKRLERAKANWAPYQCEALLCGPPFLGKSQIYQIIDDYDLELPRLYSKGFAHNNCGGFCVRAGQGHFALLLKEFPERYLHHEAKEQSLLADIPTTRPFLTIQRDKVRHYVSLKEFREMLERKEDYNQFDMGGCGCFSEVDDNQDKELT